MDAAEDSGLAVECGSCGASNPAGAEACASCGAPLPPAVMAPTPSPQETIPPKTTTQRERGGCLTIVLVLSMIGGILIIPSIILSLAAGGLSYVDLVSNVILPFGYAIGAVGVWKWRRWGVYLYAITAVLGMLMIVALLILSLALGGSLGELVVPLIALLAWFVVVGILYAIVKPKWHFFS